MHAGSHTHGTNQHVDIEIMKLSLSLDQFVQNNDGVQESAEILRLCLECTVSNSYREFASDVFFTWNSGLFAYGSSFLLTVGEQ